MKIPYTFGAMIKYIHGVLDKKANNELRNSDLTFSQITTLVVLAEEKNKQMPIKEIEAAMHITQPTATGIVKRLIQKGLVEIKTDEQDKRLKIVSITKKGESQSQKAFFLMKQAEAWLRSPLTKEEQKTFLTLLKKICDGIKE